MINDEINKRNGVASLIQLNSQSDMELNYMYSNTDSFINPLFYAEYQQITNFDRTSFSISKIIKTDSNFIHVFDHMQSDMIGNFIVELKIPHIDDQFVWCNDIGHALIEYVKVSNGDEELFTFTSDLLNITYKLDTKSSKQKGVDEMVSHYNTKHSLHHHGRTMYIDVPFLKVCEEYQYFPLLNTSNNSFKIIIKLRSIRNLVRKCSSITNTDHIHTHLYVRRNHIHCILDTNTNHLPEQDISLNFIFDSVRLSYQEKNLFLTRKSNILYQTTQYREINLFPGETEKKIQLDFQHSIKELIIVLHKQTNEEPFYFQPIEDIFLYLQGVDINNNIQSNRYDNKHENIPRYYIYVIPFSLSATSNQPSGTYSFDSIDYKYGSITTKKNELKIIRDVKYKHETSVLKIFANSYNVMKIENNTISVQYL
tara:strand:+ start:22728 stop:24002 length:1275 start_codon:yes stop_codon:yes gene_type:complete